MLKGKQTRGEAFQDDRHRWGRKPHTERVSQGRRLKKLGFKQDSLTLTHSELQSL